MRPPVLVIEDDPIQVEILKDAYKNGNMHYPLLTFDNAEELLEWVFRAKGPPHFILLDLGLPDMNGINVIEKLKAHRNTANVPIVILTGSENREEKVMAMARGVISILKKPIDPPGIIQMLKAYDGLMEAWGQADE